MGLMILSIPAALVSFNYLKEKAFDEELKMFYKIKLKNFKDY
jgi:hypothetical protein